LCSQKNNSIYLRIILQTLLALVEAKVITGQVGASWRILQTLLALVEAKVITGQVGASWRMHAATKKS
jgi:hypothetical protein